MDDTPELLAWYRDFLPSLPDEVGGFFAFLTVPPAPPFPEELHLQKVAGVVWTWTGPEEGADEALAEARAQEGILIDGVAPVPLAAFNSAFDPIYTAGDQWYWRADFVETIPDEAVEKHVEFGKAMPTWKSTMHMYPIDGAAHRLGPGETPWAYRNANWGMVMAGVDPDPANVEAISDWSRSYFDALHPFSAGGAYVNMMMEEGEERVRASYGDNYDRLARVKAQYDPGNVFHVNQNIRPAS
jgi:Berberine and berberine like